MHTAFIIIRNYFIYLSAFEANQYLNNTPHQFVYKTIKFRKDVSERRVEEHRKDALAMGQASRSEFIPDIYGYCGVAIQMPFMPEGNLHGEYCCVLLG